MKRLTLLIIAVMCAVSEWIASCTQTGGSADAIVPRRTAYPRVRLYEPSYVAIPGLPVNLSVNKSASTLVNKKNDGTYWINVDYPRYGASIRYTLQFLSGDKLREAAANRADRFSLDIAGSPGEVTELTSPSGVKTTLMLTPSASVTPLHMISTDSLSFLLSGAVEFKDHDIEANSPAVNAIYDDIIHAAKNLSAAD